MSRFIVVTNSALATPESRNLITKWLERQGMSVWHWYEDLWLVDAGGVRVSLDGIRIELLSFTPHIWIMMAEGPIRFAATVPDGSAEWIAQHFDGKPRIS